MTNSNSDETRRLTSSLPDSSYPATDRPNKFQRKAAWKDRMKALRNTTK